METKTRNTIGALFLASSLGVVGGRLSAAPSQPEVRLVALSIDPVVGLAVIVGGKPKRLQCSDASGAVVKLNGKDFPAGKSLCDAAVTFSTGAKASVGLLASDFAK